MRIFHSCFLSKHALLHFEAQNGTKDEVWPPLRPNWLFIYSPRSFWRYPFQPKSHLSRLFQHFGLALDHHDRSQSLRLQKPKAGEHTDVAVWPQRISSGSLNIYKHLRSVGTAALRCVRNIYKVTDNGVGNVVKSENGSVWTVFERCLNGVWTLWRAYVCEHHFEVVFKRLNTRFERCSNTSAWTVF